MDIFGIGTAELIVILFVAVLIFGPEQLVVIARRLGGFLRTVSRQYASLTNQLRAEIPPEVQEVQRAIQDVRDASSDLNRQLGRQLTAETRPGGTAAPRTGPPRSIPEGGTILPGPEPPALETGPEPDASAPAVPPPQEEAGP